MPVLITPALLASLRHSANKAMWSEWNRAHPAGSHIDEVSCIYNLIGRALPKVQTGWKGQLSPLGVTATLTGVVCHGRPYVRYPGAVKSCELGDFLLVHDHRPVPAVLERRAAIIQAKVFGVTGVTSKNPIQLGLYQKWPRFTYTDWPGGVAVLKSVLAAKAGITDAASGALEREMAITLPMGTTASSAQIDLGCRYGMIDTHRSPWGDPRLSMNPWRLCSPNVPNVYAHRWGLSLGSYLTRLIMGKVGRVVPYPQWPTGLANACHWSLMVEELLSLLPASQATGASVGTPPDGGGFAVILVTTNGGGAG